MDKAITTAKVSLFDAENNNETFHWLYKEQWQPLINYAYYYVKDYSVAEEVVQQLFIDIFSKNISIGQTGK
jgi:DNA-directed RNA polymerase specialized sigma24 family protein